MNPLDITFESRDLGIKLTIREYFLELLRTLWIEEEGFSGKRPFGNSGWQHDVYTALIKHGLIPGKLDEDGFIESCDYKTAKKFVLENIIDKL